MVYYYLLLDFQKYSQKYPIIVLPAVLMVVIVETSHSSDGKVLGTGVGEGLIKVVDPVGLNTVSVGRHHWGTGDAETPVSMVVTMVTASICPEDR